MPGNVAAARDALTTALGLDPRGSATYTNLARLELTTRLTPVEQRQDSLRNRLLVIGLLALLLAAAGAFVAGGVVLRPLRRLRSAAARIAGEEDLGQRVPAAGAW